MSRRRSARGRTYVRRVMTPPLFQRSLCSVLEIGVKGGGGRGLERGLLGKGRVLPTSPPPPSLPPLPLPFSKRDPEFSNTIISGNLREGKARWTVDSGHLGGHMHSLCLQPYLCCLKCDPGHCCLSPLNQGCVVSCPVEGKRAHKRSFPSDSKV